MTFLATTPEEDLSLMFMFEPMNFVRYLYYMGVGMLGIGIVIGVIILITLLLNKIFKDKAN